MRVLTFNSHQPYLHLLATALPWHFGIITPRVASGRTQAWDQRIRPLPPNARLYPSVKAASGDGDWDWILTHNVQDLMDARDISLPKVFLVHGTLSGRILQDRAVIDRIEYLDQLRILLRASRCRVVYISELKARDWGFPGEIIRNAVNPAQYGGYRGDRRGVVQVCNHLSERGAMLGWETHRIVCACIPHLILGENGGLPNSRMAQSWEDLIEQYRSYRIYLHTAVYPHEDGFNLAMLEAMATGMPIATVRHPTSPITHGIEGVVAENSEELRAEVLRLIDQPEEALRMGIAARRKVEEAFPLAAFRAAWQVLGRSLTK